MSRDPVLRVVRDARANKGRQRTAVVKSCDVAKLLPPKTVQLILFSIGVGEHPGRRILTEDGLRCNCANRGPCLLGAEVSTGSMDKAAHSPL